MTANPNWPEVRANLRPGEVAANRPELIARVFHAKLKKLITKIKKGFLGRVLAFTWVVEFQKRGLPHAHMLVIVAPEHKPRTPSQVDAIVTAELPDPITLSLLFFV